MEKKFLEVVRDLEYAPNNDALTYLPSKTKPKNKINVILGTVGMDYKDKKTNKYKIAAILPTQKNL